MTPCRYHIGTPRYTERGVAYTCDRFKGRAGIVKTCPESCKGYKPQASDTPQAALPGFGQGSCKGRGSR